MTLNPYLMDFKKGGGGSFKTREFNKAVLMPLVEKMLDERILPYLVGGGDE